MSRITAPVGDVTTPMTRGRYGSGFLRASSNSPSAASAFRRASSSAISAPAPAGSSASMTSWYFDWPGKVVSLPLAITSTPSSGLNFRRGSVIRHTTASSRALSSFSVKYEWPEECAPL